MVKDNVYVIRVTNLSVHSKEDEIFGMTKYVWKARKLVKLAAESLAKSLDKNGVYPILQQDSNLSQTYNLVWEQTLSSTGKPMNNDRLSILLVRRDNGWVYSAQKPRYRITAEKVYDIDL